MNIALIFAGGTGSRMKSTGRPKQFLELHGKPIIIHTLEHFENHPEIDAICVVCIAEWIDYLKKLLDRYLIRKVRWIVPGGASGQLSIFNGIDAVYNTSDIPKDSTILVHDGVRPLINDKLISDCISMVAECGNAITVAPAIETVVLKNKDEHVESILDRSMCSLARAPQCFVLSDLFSAHIQAQKDHIENFIDSANLMNHYGHKLNIVEGPSENIKITTPLDFYVFRAIYEARENTQIYGL